MDRTACTEPQCLYKGDIYLYLSCYNSHLFLPYYFNSTIAKPRSYTETSEGYFEIFDLYKNEYFFTASDILLLGLFFLAKKHVVIFSYIRKFFFFFCVLFTHSERADLTNLNWRLGTSGMTVGSTVASHSNNIKQNVQITRPHILKYSSLCCP